MKIVLADFVEKRLIHADVEDDDDTFLCGRMVVSQ
jgi:hypothetical protein